MYQSNMLGVYPNQFQPSTIGSNFTASQTIAPPQQPPSMTNNTNRNWALMRALQMGNGGGVPGAISQIAGAYMLKNGGFFG